MIRFGRVNEWANEAEAQNMEYYMFKLSSQIKDGSNNSPLLQRKWVNINECARVHISFGLSMNSNNKFMRNGRDCVALVYAHNTYTTHTHGLLFAAEVDAMR